MNSQLNPSPQMAKIWKADFFFFFLERGGVSVRGVYLQGNGIGKNTKVRQTYMSTTKL